MHSRQAIKKVSMMASTISIVPFEKVVLNIGPIHPPSSAGHKFILTLVDWATRFSEVITLGNINLITIAEAHLITIFSRNGIQRDIVRDQRRQVIYSLMGKVHKFLITKPIFTTPCPPTK